jgi:hypothetical protein
MGRIALTTDRLVSLVALGACGHDTGARALSGAGALTSRSDVTAGVPAARIDTSWSGEMKQNLATANNVAERQDRVVDITVVQQ